VVRSQGPSFDGADRNSGILGFVTNSSGVFMAVTPHARDRYNAMIDAGLGTNFLPHLSRDYGVSTFTNGTFLFTPEALVDFGVMNRIRKSGM
jgi:hypothetical protein